MTLNNKKNAENLIENITKYIKNYSVYGVLLSKKDILYRTIEEPLFDATHLTSGFTGSNAHVFITESDRLIFTDKRYYQRAELETDFTIIYDNPYKWLASNLRTGARVALDPMRFAHSNLAVIRNFLKPDYEIYSKLGLPSPNFSAEKISIGTRHDEQLSVALTSWGADAALLMPEMYSWLTGERDKKTNYNKALPKYGLAIIRSENSAGDHEKHHIDRVSVGFACEPNDTERLEAGGNIGSANYSTDHIYSVEAVAGHKAGGEFGLTDRKILQTKGYGVDEIRVMSADFGSLKGKTVAVEMGYIPDGLVEFLTKNGAKILDKSISKVQSIKTKDEIEGMRLANKIDARALIALFEWIRESVEKGRRINELDVSDYLLELKSIHPDFLGESFKTICAAGPNSSIIHYDPSANPRFIAPGDLVLIDSGSHYVFGTTDITRTISTGPVTTRQKQVYSAVLSGLVALKSTKFPPALEAKYLDSMARQALWNLGLDYPHSTGHGIGLVLNVHEAGFGIGRGYGVLEPNVVVSCEPGCYIPGEFGVRLEDDVVVEETDGGWLKLSSMTEVPFDATLIV